MQGIISLLDSVHYTLVQDLWKELESDCGLVGIKVTPLPHFSWLIAENYNMEKARLFLRDFAVSLHPFTIHATGIGLFTGTLPVIYIPLVKDPNLIQLHQTMWENTLTFAKNPSEYYAPRAWVPHITLAHGDVTHSSLGCAMDKLGFRPFDWTIRIDHLALVYQPDGMEGWLEEKFNFQN